MKKLSGAFLTKVLSALEKANQSELSSDEIGLLLMNALKVENLYVEFPPLPATLPAAKAPARFSTFDDENLRRLNALLPWSSFAAIGDQAILGTAWSQRKRFTYSPQPDPLVETLFKRIQANGMSALELGCFEGHHSISLANHCDEVWAIDGRIENVMKTFTRVWMAGLEHRINVNLLDLERGRLKDQLAGLHRTEGFDLIHHRGVLYHLSNPVANLVECGEVCKKHLYLHTQISAADQANVQLQLNGKSYAAWAYKEPADRSAPFAGITPVAHWMTQESLTTLLHDIGFPKVEIMALDEERNGLRLELLASR